MKLFHKKDKTYKLTHKGQLYKDIYNIIFHFPGQETEFFNKKNCNLNKHFSNITDIEFCHLVDEIYDNIILVRDAHLIKEDKYNV